VTLHLAKPSPAASTQKAALAAQCAGKRLLGRHTLRHPDTFSAANKSEVPTVGSQTKGIEKNADGPYDVYFAPKPPEGKEGNWLQTIPGESWFTILRMYGSYRQILVTAGGGQAAAVVG